jgi:hypothetical protein
VDTLRGSLDTFALPEIVRLIASSGKTGVLTAETFRLKGRIFLDEGAINFATTRGDDGDVEDLRRMTTSPAGNERRGRKDSSPGQTLEDVVEQQALEVFVRLMRMSGGKFVFDEGARTRAFGTGAVLRLDVDKVIDQATSRITEWLDIETVVPSPTTRFTLNRDLADDEFEVTLDARSWTFLAAVGDAASVQDLAERLRIFEFPAARKVAEFVRRGLLVPADAKAEFSTVPVIATETKPADGPSVDGDAEASDDHAASDDLPTEAREHGAQADHAAGRQEGDEGSGDETAPAPEASEGSDENASYSVEHGPESVSPQPSGEMPPPPPGHDGAF